MARTAHRNRSTEAEPEARRPRRRLAQVLASIAGVVFLAVGILGFIPGITSNFDDMAFAGHESDAELFGLFEVSVVHNLVHLLFGVLGLVASRRSATAAIYLLASGAAYLVLTVFGAVVGDEDSANVVPVNTADDWLHLGLGVGLIVLGLIAQREIRTPRPPAP
jgi:hypothetical protein